MEQQIADLKALLHQIIRSGGLDTLTLNEACRVLGVPLGDPKRKDLDEGEAGTLAASFGLI